MDIKEIVNKQYGSVMAFSRETNIKTVDFYAYLRGEQSPSAKNLLKMAKALDMNCFELANKLNIKWDE